MLHLWATSTCLDIMEDLDPFNKNGQVQEDPNLLQRVEGRRDGVEDCQSAIGEGNAMPYHDTIGVKLSPTKKMGRRVSFSLPFNLGYRLARSSREVHFPCPRYNRSRTKDQNRQRRGGTPHGLCDESLATSGGTSRPRKAEESGQNVECRETNT